ncbi:MAG TPA: cellulase family glycosylhydrolase [Solirubrobacter sp.]
MPRSLAASLSLLTLALALFALPARAHAAAGMELALQDDAVFVDQRWMERDTALDHAVELGVTRIRVNVLWARLIVGDAEARHAPHTVTYDFSRIDALQDAAAARGIKLQLTIAGPAPAWATANHRVGNYRPDAAQFGAFVKAVVGHFQGRVDRYAIWNEPNWNTWLAPGRTAASQYRALYSTGYKAIKAVDPKAKVLIGELAPIGGGRAIAPLKFLRDVTCSKANYAAAKKCAPLVADGFAIHPYQFTSAPNVFAGRADDVPIGALSRLTTALDKLSRRNALRTPSKAKMGVYLTEFGYLTEGLRAQKPKVRAAWLASAFTLASRNPRVKQLLQYQLVDPPEDEIWHSALLHRDGSPQATYSGLAKAFASSHR